MNLANYMLSVIFKGFQSNLNFQLNIIQCNITRTIKNIVFIYKQFQFLIQPHKNVDYNQASIIVQTVLITLRISDLLKYMFVLLTAILLFETLRTHNQQGLAVILVVSLQRVIPKGSIFFKIKTDDHILYQMQNKIWFAE